MGTRHSHQMLLTEKSDLVQVLAQLQTGDKPLPELTRTQHTDMHICIKLINSSPPGKNGHHFADDIFRCIFVNEKICILIKISPKFVPKGPIDNNPALV